MVARAARIFHLEYRQLDGFLDIINYLLITGPWVCVEIECHFVADFLAKKSLASRFQLLECKVSAQ